MDSMEYFIAQAYGSQPYTIDAVKVAHGFDGSVFYVVECLPSGHFFYCPDADTFLEYGLTSDSPYKGHDEYLYYVGMLEYYVFVDGAYYNPVTERVLTEEDLPDYIAYSASFYQHIMETTDEIEVAEGSLIVYVSDAERRIPIQYSKRVVGRKIYGGQSTSLPMKVNMSGVLPIIFAQSIAALPATVCAFVSKWQNSWIMKNVFDTTTWPYVIIYFLLIIFFAYFYSTIQFNPIEVSNNLRKNGGYIPGYRPGKPTSEFLQKVLNKITLFGAIYLGIVAVVPIIITMFSDVAQKTGLSIGGTSIIIVVGVALETVRALEAQMLMRNYKGFLS